MTRDEFVARATEAAKAACSGGGTPPGVAVAQAILESAAGQSQLSRAANNYFGIKAHGKHPAMEFRTTEFEGGVAKQIVARFAAFESMEECFACRERLLMTSATYADARAVVDDPRAFARAMAKHWATDPHYAEKLLKVYDTYGLGALDEAHGRRA